MLRPINWSLALPYYAAALAFGYLLGSIPFGLILTRLAGTQDVRAIGSGNIGATNVLRTGRKGLAAATLLCDMLKGTVAALVTYHFFGPDLAILAGIGAFLGHVFPIWLKFKGGKGVATYIGVLLALAWPAALAFGAIWLLVAAATRYSSLAALIAGAATPAILWFNKDLQEAEVFLVLTVMIFITHRANIARLINGTEGKIGQGAKPK
jgi:acyl phosphate:glycerol-3-phosphate acyltransferase